jgi:hypothetical protein
MNGMDYSPEIVTDRYLTQYRAVVEAARAVDIELEPRDPQPGDRIPDFIHERDALVVNEADVDLVRRTVTVNEAKHQAAPRRVGPLVVLPISGLTAVQAIERLEKIKRGVARPNHLFSICPVNLCPAEEPYPVPASTVPQPVLDPAPGPGVGHDVQLRVIDTGLIDPTQLPGYQQAHPWLFSPPEPQPVGPTQELVDNATGLIREYAGHGTFIAGLIKRVAPAAAVTVSNELQMAGAIMEDALANALLDALSAEPDIISLSAGGTTFDGNPPACFAPVKDRLAQSNRTLLVAAAGNNGSATEKFWPAAYAPELPGKVLAVGALRRDVTGRACFSNYGGWVTVYAPGERLANAFVSGDYRYFDPPALACRYYPSPALYGPCTCVTAAPQYAQVEFKGMCSWSGTSFATPIVAGAVAAYMTEQGQPNAQQAAAEFGPGGSQTKLITDTDPMHTQLAAVNLG